MQAKKGVALILVLLVLLVIFGLVTAFLYLMTVDWRITNNLMFDTMAIYIADAGIEDAVYELIKDINWAAGFTNKEFPANSGYTYTVTVQPISANVKQLTSTSNVAGYRKTIIAWVRLKNGQAKHRVTFLLWKIQ